MSKKKTKKKAVKLYTKTGDKGMSNVINGIRIPKDDLIFEVVGTLDELNSHLGFSLAIVEDEALRTELMRIQDALLNHGAVVAGSTKIILFCLEELNLRLELTSLVPSVAALKEF